LNIKTTKAIATTSSNQKILIEYHKQEIEEKTTIANGRATKNID
jgi:hypothetical protein